MNNQVKNTIKPVSIDAYKILITETYTQKMVLDFKPENIRKQFSNDARLTKRAMSANGLAKSGQQTFYQTMCLYGMTNVASPY